MVAQRRARGERQQAGPSGLSAAARHVNSVSTSPMADETDAALDKTPRTERGRKTLRRLLEAAASEFGARGYHGSPTGSPDYASEEI